MPSLRPGLSILPLVCLALLMSGCSGDRGGRLEDVKVELTLSPTPPRVGPTKAVVSLRDKEGKPLRGATLKFEGNMNHAGMKPVFADAKETDPGRYEANMELTMGGDWFVLITGKLGDGRSLKEKVDVPGVKSD